MPTATLQLQACKQHLSTPATSWPVKHQQMKGDPGWYIVITAWIHSLEIHESKILRSMLCELKSCKLTAHLYFCHIPIHTCRNLPLLFLIFNMCWPAWFVYKSPQMTSRNALWCTAHPTRSELHQNSLSHLPSFSSAIIKIHKLNRLSH